MSSELTGTQASVLSSTSVLTAQCEQTGGAPKDPYNQPLLAPEKWFSSLPSIVSDILIWGGGGEVLLDSIRAISDVLKKAQPKTELVVQSGAAHEDFIIEKLLGYNEKAEGTEVIEAWLGARLG